MPGSSRLPVSLRETFQAQRRATPRSQLLALNLDMYDDSQKKSWATGTEPRNPPLRRLLTLGVTQTESAT